jgi:Secretion system C-terminal sorting domain
MLEVTTEIASSTPLDVKRQFKDYRTKGIPIESYLAHNYNMSGASAVLECKNDFVICSPDPMLATTLTMEANSKLNLYDGNTLTVREGNKLVIRDGAQLIAGLTDADYEGDFGIPTIKLLANAELVIEANAKLFTKKGLLIEMAEGSKWTIDGAICKPENLSDAGITIINHGGTIEIINGGVLRTRNSQPMVHSMINGTVLIDDGQFICENPSNAHSWFLLDCDVHAYHSSIFQMSGDLHLDHSNLSFNHLSDLKIHDGSIHVLEGSRITWNGETVEIIGELSFLEFDGGVMEIGANKTFAPVHPSQPSGYIEFKGADDHDLYLNQGSVFLLEGDNNEDIMLKMVDYADLWPKYIGPNPEDFNGIQGSIQLKKCKVEMHNHGRIWTDQDFDAYRVKFDAGQSLDLNHSGELRSYYETEFDLKYCDFDQVKLFGLGSDLYATTCNFISSKVDMKYGHYNINASNFHHSPLWSDAANNMCRITNCQFMDSGSDVLDGGLVELKVDKSQFHGAQLEKNDGILSLHCNYFADAINAVTAVNAHLSMSSNSGNGYNQFYNVSNCVTLERASGFEIYDGFNDFSGYSQCCICGSVTWSCTDPNCSMWLKTSQNFWGTSAQDPFTPDYLYHPNSPNVEIHLYAQDGTNKLCNQVGEAGIALGCEITVLDDSPIYSPECGLSKPVVRKERRSAKLPVLGDVSMAHQHQLRDLSMDAGNPILNTANFNNYSLDSALVAAAWMMEVYDSLGNDAQAVAYFEEILTSGLDRSNSEIRWRMEWGRRQMKAAVESMFVDQELSKEANETAFETSVQNYVNVLNMMTDTLLTDSTYKDQFYVELDKGQLFRTIGQPVIAKYIFEHLGDCQLDSLEQIKLNQWMYEVDMELATKYEYLFDSLSWDTTMVVIDSTLYPVPIDVTLSNYYFGVWISGPQDVAFVNCGQDLSFRSLLEESQRWSVYPNPTTDMLSIACQDKNVVKLRIYNAAGQCMDIRTIDFEESQLYQLNLDPSWSAGNYLLCKESDGATTFKKFVIQK